MILTLLSLLASIVSMVLYAVRGNWGAVTWAFIAFLWILQVLLREIHEQK